MKLLLLKEMANDHLYSHFVQALADAIAELGHEAVITDQYVHTANGAIPTGPLVADLQQHAPDAFVSFRAMFGGVTLTNGTSLFDGLGVKFVGWLFDHPVYAPQSFTRELQGRYAVYSSPAHRKFAKAMSVPGRGTVMLPGAELPGAPLKPHSARDWPILIAATWQGQPQRLWENVAEGPGRRLWKGMVDALLADRDASLIDAFEASAKAAGIGVSLGQDPGFDAAVLPMLREALTYVRQYDRIEAIRAIVETGLPVALCGSGWETVFGHRPAVTYLPPVPFAEMPRLYQNARSVLNLNAGNGASERAVYAAASGAAVVSNAGAELQAFFDDAITFYDRTRPTSAGERFAELLEGGVAEERAERARERVNASGLWRHRAEQLIEFVQT
ncbi:glycosyltransferase family protein [Phenylobacterium deserti]|uniref:Spore protein YkvP/CgeB glycosyl transferase-like domain-containing protein n=1 Tax=Phenylobacterium deserti TaxID=1914756 RepID=A0A328APY2_9CAUL|nr:glycosyltransferase [Phenylobacterium deserti]RAK56415.1 hypothetical protein DJ018_00030 [Phenylobacterium deserti]